MSPPTNRPLFLIIIGCLILGVGWITLEKLRGPILPGYEVTAQRLVQIVVATGRVLALSRVQVGSEVTGVVLERLVQEGDVVHPGDTLVVLRSDDLEAALKEAEAALAELEQSTRPQAQASLREAQAKLTQTSREVERRRVLLQRQMIASETLEQVIQVETIARIAVEQAQLAARSLAAGNPSEMAARARVASARAQLAKTRIRSEVAGTILTRNAEPGDLVQPGRVMFDIARAGDTEVLVPVDEKNLEVLALGQSALCIADAFPARPFLASVNFIAPRVDPQRGTVDIRLTVEPAPDFLRQDMTVSVNIETGRRDRAIVVPNDVLTVLDGNRAKLWLVDDGLLTRRAVDLGLRGLTHSEVISGLQVGDWILVDAQAVLTSGDRVRVKSAKPGIAPADSAGQNELPVRMD